MHIDARWRPGGRRRVARPSPLARGACGVAANPHTAIAAADAGLACSSARLTYAKIDSQSHFALLPMGFIFDIFLSIAVHNDSR
jgi:hypothetical protein